MTSKSENGSAWAGESSNGNGGGNFRYETGKLILDSLPGSSKSGEAGGPSSPDQASVEDEQGNEVIIAIPPLEIESGGDYHTISLSGSTALDILDQVRNNGLA